MTTTIRGGASALRQRADPVPDLTPDPGSRQPPQERAVHPRRRNPWSPSVLGAGRHRKPAGPWTNNKDLMVQVAIDHVPDPSPDLVGPRRHLRQGELLDARGPVRPKPTTNDVEPHDGHPTFDHSNYRSFPTEWANRWNVVIWDPPYMSKGTRRGYGFEEMNRSYGLVESPRSAKDLRDYNHAGLTEIARITAPGGTICVKYMDGVESGDVVEQIRHLRNHAADLGLVYVDRYLLITGPRSQPPRTSRKTGYLAVQEHTGNNVSELTVYRKPDTRGPKVDRTRGWATLDDMLKGAE